MPNSHAALVESLIDGFASAFGNATNVAVAMAPGRVNLLGDHTDYNDGFVLPMTVDRGVYIALRKREDRTVRVASVRYAETIEYDIDQFEPPKPGSWASYVLGVVEELRLRGLLDCGFEAIVDGNLDLGAGLSSSAALEVATAVSLQHVMGFKMDPVDMVKLCQHVEHSYANVLCGIMDQFASRIGQQDHALFLDCRSLEYRNIPLALGDYRIVIVSSGVKRSLSASAYNTRLSECRQGVAFFSEIDETVRALRDVTPGMLEEHGDGLAPTINRRCRHVVEENDRVLRAVTALEDGNFDEFGALMYASHDSLRDDYEVSSPELDMLVELARETDGVLGSRMTGAGFGGCTVSLVRNDAVQAFSDHLHTDYTSCFGLEPGVYVLEGNREAGPIRLDD